MELSIILLNWNAAGDTLRCIQAISRWQKIKPTIWVVDNASVDDSVVQIHGKAPQVRLIQSAENLGFAGGSNLGIRASLAERERPILMLNNDATIDEDSVIRLMTTLAEGPANGFVGPLLYEAEHSDRLISAGGKNPVLHQNTRLTAPPEAAATFQVDCISGTAILIAADVFRRVGLLDETYFFSTELADLCARATGQGFRCLIDTRAQARHTVSRSARFRDTLYVYYVIRNRFIYIRKFYSRLAKGALLSFWSIYSLALALKLRLTGQRATAKAVWLGLEDGLRQRFGGQNERVLAACRVSGASLDTNLSET
jgi:GT2 family glycosyltransferase